MRERSEIVNTKLTAPVIKEAIEALQEMETIEDKSDRMDKMRKAKALIFCAEELTFLEYNTK